MTEGAREVSKPNQPLLSLAVCLALSCGGRTAPDPDREALFTIVTDGALQRAHACEEARNPNGQAVDFIVSDVVGGGTSLTQNGFHQAVRVGGMVFDNFLRQGVPYAEYVGALEARFGVVIESVPF